MMDEYQCRKGEFRTNELEGQEGVPMRVLASLEFCFRSDTQHT